MLARILIRHGLICSYRFADDPDAVLKLLEKFSQVPMSFADAGLVRITEVVNDPTLLTTDADFRIYRRHGRQMIPCMLPR
jgi:uncharacterized protein